MNSSIIIFTRQKSSRLQYIINVIFGGLLDTEYTLTADFDDYEQYPGIKINYSSQKISDQELWIAPVNLLFEQNIEPQEIVCQSVNGLPAAFFHDIPEADLPFDLFAFCFFLLSRYEEYYGDKAAFDQHGRFKAESSFAYKNNFLGQPLINQWSIRLGGMITRKYPQIKFRAKSFQFVPTFDIDLAWAFKERSLQRRIMSMVRDVLKQDWKSLGLRKKVLKGKAEDPFDTYDYINNIHSDLGYAPIFFFLLGDFSRYDRNIDPSNSQLQKLIHKQASKYQIGIHPSYQSHQSEGRLAKEIKRLEQITGKEVIHSRFHFLKFKLPHSFQQLIKLGIKHEYSMGYAGALGFRASIAQAFPWYDLANEQQTNLIIHPFQVMDGTLKNYLKLSPQESLTKTYQLMEETASVGGFFSTLWHNSSFSYIEAWEEWAEVYEAILQKAQKLRH